MGILERVVGEARAVAMILAAGFDHGRIQLLLRDLGDGRDLLAQ